MADYKCSVYACYEPVKARHLCNRHYHLWCSQRRLPPHDGTAGVPRNADEPLVCVCARPTPDGIGECQRCHRLVVTFAYGCEDTYRAAFPGLWARAEKLGLVPHRAS